jgi:hypothetical protein
MKRQFWFGCLAFQALISASILAPAQQSDEEESRGKFITTRPKAPAGKSNQHSQTGPAPSSALPEPATPDVVPDAKPVAVQVGYTLYQKRPDGTTVRVDPTKIFHAKDALRLLIEPNTNGYLYVFTTENDGKATMLFPNKRLNHGDNRVLAHVPYEVPSSHEPKEPDQWFVFDERPAIERLYLVFARQPLPHVLSGEELLAYCQLKKDCSWEPPSMTWNQIVAETKAPKVQSMKRSEGQALSESEMLASSRSLGLTKSDPEPWMVQTNAEPNSHTLAVMVELTHR